MLKIYVKAEYLSLYQQEWQNHDTEDEFNTYYDYSYPWDIQDVIETYA